MKKVSIDIDGVIATSFISKATKLVNIYLNKKRRDYESYNRIEKVIHSFIYKHPTRPIPSAHNAIYNLNKNSFKVILNSARPSFLYNATSIWLKKHRMDHMVDILHLRETGHNPIKAKIKSIRQTKATIHIDDDPFIVKELAKLKQLKQIYYIKNGKYSEKAISFLNEDKKVIVKNSLGDAVENILGKKSA